MIGKPCTSAFRTIDANLECLRELDEVRLALVHLALHQSLLLLGQPLPFVRNKITERWEGIRRWLV